MINQALCRLLSLFRLYGTRITRRNSPSHLPPFAEEVAKKKFFSVFRRENHFGALRGAEIIVNLELIASQNNQAKKASKTARSASIRMSEDGELH